MALTNELLAANTELAGLTDAQKAAIVELSKNDEAQVIGQKVGEIYGGLDTDILNASGIAKNGTEKTYDYAKRVIGEIKGKADQIGGLQTQITELTNEKTRLQGIIDKNGTDEETKRQLTQTKADLENVQRQYNELKTNYDNDKAKYEKDLFNVKLDGEFANATAGLKFKADLPESAQKVLLQQAIAKVKGMNPAYVDNGNGGKVLAFMDNGAVMRNPDNKLNPFTANELIARELKNMGVLETGRQQQGAGSQGGQGGGGGQGGSYDLSGARTQSEAQDIIAKQLMSQGKIKGTAEFEEAMNKAWKENYEALKSLPMN
jgi:hypothetical protein